MQGSRLTEKLAWKDFGQFLALEQHGELHVPIVTLIELQNFNRVVSQEIVQYLFRKQDKRRKKN